MSFLGFLKFSPSCFVTSLVFHIFCFVIVLKPSHARVNFGMTFLTQGYEIRKLVGASLIERDYVVAVESDTTCSAVSALIFISLKGLFTEFCPILWVFNKWFRWSEPKGNPESKDKGDD